MDARYLQHSEREIQNLSLQLLDMAKDDDRRWLIVYSLVRLGIKNAELIRLQKKNVDWKNNIITVPYQKDQIKKVPFDEEYRGHLKRFLSSRTDSNPALFVKKTEREYLGPEIRGVLDTMCKKIGLVYPVDSHFCIASSSLYFLSLGKPLTETANALGFHLVTKFLFFLKKAGLLLPTVK